MFAPRYYKDFVCTADRCTHSCCVGWEIDIDEDTLALYKSLEDPLGAEILKTVKETDGGAHFCLDEKGRCQNLDARGLCRIIRALGEGALCDICHAHPRFYHDTDREEVGLGCACEAAAALILSSDAYGEFIVVDGDNTPVSLATDFNARAAREALYQTLGNRSLPLHARIAALTARHGTPAPLPLHALEYLDGAHRTLFLHAAEKSAEISAAEEKLCERFLAYLIYRHASPATSPADFSRAVRLALSLLSLFAALITDTLSPVAAAVALSEEIEYSEENTALLLKTV